MVQIIHIIQEVQINWDILEELMYQITIHSVEYEEAQLGILEPSY